MSRNIKINGMVVASPASITVSVDGTQVYSGAVGADAELDTAIVLQEVEIENADDTQWATKAVTVSVTSGIVKVGTMPANTGDVSGIADENILGQQDGAGYYNPGRHSSPYGETTERTSILIDGSAPVVLNDQGFEHGDHFSGWFFEVAAGETFACTLRIPPLAANL